MNTPTTLINRAGNVLALRTIGVFLWGFPLAGVILLVLSRTSHATYDFVVGMLLAVIGSIGATVGTIAVVNAIADEKQAERHSHPSFPYKVK